MNNIIIGAARGRGSFQNDKKETIKFDNILIYIADFRGVPQGGGFCLSNKMENNVIKIPTKNFEGITGIKPGNFLARFEEKYMYHKVRAFLEKDSFGKARVSLLRIGSKDCFKLWEEEQLADKDELDIDDSNDGYSDDFDFDETSDNADPELSVDDFEVDADTGEAAPKGKKGGDKK